MSLKILKQKLVRLKFSLNNPRMKKLFSLLIFLLPFVFPSPVSAHAFGQVYNLPVPVSYYLYGAGGVVLISFLALSVILKGDSLAHKEYRKDISENIIKRLLVNDVAKFVLKLWSFTGFVFIILAGFIGNQEPTSNLVTIYVWVIQLLGITYLISTLGNFWPLINPWRNFIDFLEAIRGRKFIASGEYSDALGYAPATIFYFFFVWLELLSGNLAQSPKFLSELILFYSIITISGAILFGSEVWFKYGEFWSVIYRILSRASLFEERHKRFYIRIPFSGLLKSKNVDFGLLFFTLLMLSSTAFDGFRATIEYLKLQAIFINILGPLPQSTEQMLDSGLLFSFWLIFIAAYLLAIVLMKFVTKSRRSFGALAADFTLALVPIAFVYNIAHYFTLLLIQGQSLISAVSDPFNLGWNLFGTADYIINPGVVGAKTVWNTQVALIILGHVIGVLIAHIISTRIFDTHKKAVWSQVPMVILMVGYTLFGLWILSQPFRLGG